MISYNYYKKKSFTDERKSAGEILLYIQKWLDFTSCDNELLKKKL